MQLPQKRQRNGSIIFYFFCNQIERIKEYSIDILLRHKVTKAKTQIMTEPVPDLFISYCWGKEKANQKKVIQFKEYMTKNHHWTLWMDIDQITVGHQLNTAIEKAIRGCKAAIIVLTPEYGESKNCVKEISLADAMGKPLIPIIFEDVAWPPENLGFYLSQTIYAKFDGSGKQFWSKEAMTGVISQIQSHLPEIATGNGTDSNSMNGPPETEPSKSPDRINTKNWFYIGEHENNLPHGCGIKKWKSGAIHNGSWHKGQAHGKGTRTYANCDVYHGDWVKDQQEGQGHYIWNRDPWFGDSYFGRWKEGKKSGKGQYKWHTGETYNGNWVNGLRTGKGVYTWPSGIWYEGEFKNSKRHGRGVQKSVAGTITTGTWENGKRISGQVKSISANMKDNNKSDSCVIM